MTTTAKARVGSDENVGFELDRVFARRASNGALSKYEGWPGNVGNV